MEEDGRLSGRPLRIIGVTANARDEQIDEMIACGFQAVLPKPFRMQELMEKLQDLVETT